ncbi:hypothetical protein SDC9_211503 [bioreactor metagenome]|uniref:Uncharacterized protein n=1 Tax=bioreactor metagenome TaxID=1076179 RepID=A0A645JK49_9ZZZZ
MVNVEGRPVKIVAVIANPVGNRLADSVDFVIAALVGGRSDQNRRLGFEHHMLGIRVAAPHGFLNFYIHVGFLVLCIVENRQRVAGLAVLNV